MQYITTALGQAWYIIGSYELAINALVMLLVFVAGLAMGILLGDLPYRRFLQNDDVANTRYEKWKKERRKYNS